MQRNIALSFSGGKDSCFALYKLYKQKINVVCLVTTVWKENKKTVAHEQKLEELKDQAKSLALPIHFIYTSFETYIDDYLFNLQLLKKKHFINGIAFGDIYLEGHRQWGTELARKVGLDALYPLWDNKKNALGLLEKFVGLGFKSKIIKIDPTVLPDYWLGREVNSTFIDDIKCMDICPMGESGEYHTFVYDGPIFHQQINV